MHKKITFKRGMTIYTYLQSFVIVIILVLTFFIGCSLLYEVNKFKHTISDEQFNITSRSLYNELIFLIKPAIQLGTINTSEFTNVFEIIHNDRLLTKFISVNSSDLILYNEFKEIRYDFIDGTYIRLYEETKDNKLSDKNNIKKYVIKAFAIDPHTDEKKEYLLSFDKNLNEISRYEKEYVVDESQKDLLNFITMLFSTNEKNSRFKQINEESFSITTPFNSNIGMYSVIINCADLLSITDGFDFHTSFFIFNDYNIITYQQIDNSHQKVFTSNNYNNLQLYSNDFLNLVNIFEKKNLSKAITQIYNKTSGTLQHINISNTQYQYKIINFYIGSREFKLFILGNPKILEQHINELLYNIIIFTLSISLILITLSHYYSKQLSKKLIEIGEFAEAIRKNKKNNSLKANTIFLEVNNLISLLISMKKNISKQKAKLLNQQKNLEQAINEKTIELVKALNLANESIKIKTQFLSTVSHELRTPINAILGFSYLIDRKNLTNDQKEQLENIFYSSEHLLHTINDILDLSKLEAGKLILESYPFSMKKLIMNVYNMTKHMAENKGLKLIVNFDENIPSALIGDPNKLRQVLLNLIGNAIKFTNEGEITISIKNISISQTPINEAQVQIVISDTGIGMTQKQVSKLFSPFYQADASINRKYGGSGLGLCISHEIITLMNGTINIESEITVGSKFIIDLKFVISDKKVTDEFFAIENIYTPYTNKKFVLVVDDNTINLKVLKALLEKANLNVDTAQSGIEAISKVKTNYYDLIFMDIQMPEMDGITTTKHIRNLLHEHNEIMPKTNIYDVPIIAVTANAMVSDKEECLNAGMNAYITKPIIPNELFKIINQYNN